MLGTGLFGTLGFWDLLQAEHEPLGCAMQVFLQLSKEYWSGFTGLQSYVSDTHMAASSTILGHPWSYGRVTLDVGRTGGFQG